MEANNTHSSSKGGSSVLPPKPTHPDPPEANESGIRKKTRTFIYATPAVGMHNHSLKRGSLTEPRDFGSKRKISFTHSTDSQLLDDNINEERDLRILKYIFDENLPKSEILASIDDCQCSRSNFDTLKPEQYVDDLVINTYIAMVEYDERKRFQTLSMAPRNWFLPTTFERLLNGHPNWDAEEIYKKFFSKDRHGASDLTRTHKIFIVLNRNNSHWFVCVIDFCKAHVHIIDSLSGMDSEKRFTQLEPMLERIHGALMFGFEKTYVRNIMTFPRKMMKDVAKQQNSHDCGLFTMMYTRAYSRAQFDLLSNLPTSETLRNVIALQIVKHDANMVKDSVFNHVQTRAN